MQNLQQADKRDIEDTWYEPTPQTYCRMQEMTSGALIITDSIFRRTSYSTGSTNTGPGK